MSSKSENIALQRQQALAKKQAIEANSAALRTKLENIQKQLKANDEKIAKIDYFLGKLDDTSTEKKD